MLSPSECLLQADNFVIAAQLAPEEERMALLEKAAYWRRLAFELQMERFGPFMGEEGGEGGPKDRTPGGRGPLAD